MKKTLLIFLACAVLFVLSVPGISHAKVISGSITGQYIKNDQSPLKFNKLREYSIQPEEFSLDTFDLLYKTRVNRLSLDTQNLGGNDVQSALRFDQKHWLTFTSSYYKTPHQLSFNTAPYFKIATERVWSDWKISLFPQDRHRLTFGQFQEDKTGNLDATTGVGQRNKASFVGLDSVFLHTNVHTGFQTRKFDHNSTPAKEDTADIAFRTNPTKRHYAELSYSESALKPETVNAAAKIEKKNLDVDLTGTLSNRLSVNTEFSVDRRSNDTPLAYAEKRTDWRVGGDYDAGSLSTNVYYDMVSKDLTNAGVTSADANTLGLGFNYLYSIFKVKFNYTETDREVGSITDPGFEDFSQLSGKTSDRNAMITLRGLSQFGASYFYKDNRVENNLVTAYGVHFTKTRLAGFTSYYLYDPKNTFTFNVFKTGMGLSAMTQNRDNLTDWNLGILETTLMYQLGFTSIIDDNNTLSGGWTRTSGLVRDGIRPDNHITEREYSLSLSHDFNTRTSMDVTLTTNHFYDLYDTDYNGKSHEIVVRATRKF